MQPLAPMVTVWGGVGETIMSVSREEYAAMLQAIGHYRGAVIHQANDRWRAECECGYVSATRTSAALAVEAVEHHRRKQLRSSSINGVSLRGSVPARS